jgi:hypothetical protein
MYLVSPGYLNGKAQQTPPPPLPSLVSKEAKMPGTPPPLPQKKRTNKKSKSKGVVKKKKERSSDECVNLRAKLQEADLERKREIKTIADFLKKKYYPHLLLNRRYCQKSERFIRVHRPFGVLFLKRHPRHHPP